MIKKFLMLSCLISLSLFAATPQNNIDAIVATVDGEPISLGDILPVTINIEKPLYASRSGEELEKAIREVRLKVLDEIINQKLIVAEFNRTQPFTIPKQMIERYLDDMAENMGIRSRSEFIAQLRKADMNIEDLRKKASEQLIVQAMRSRHSFVHVNITPKEIYDYYKANLTTLGTPERWELAMILVSAKKADRATITKEISEKLKDATIKEFTDLAIAYSSGPNAKLGGGIGFLDRVNLRSEFAESIQEPKEGKFYGPIATDEGDYFLAITAIKSAVVPEINELSEQIKSKMSKKLRKEALRKYIDDLRVKSLIKYYL